MSYPEFSVYNDIVWSEKFSTETVFDPPPIKFSPPIASNGDPTTVCIIGGGLAGLAAAYELFEVYRGRERELAVTLLEASGRIGGRVLTHRFDSSVYGELGAMRIPFDHKLVRRYVEDLGLPDPRTFVNRNFNGYLYVANKRFHRHQYQDAFDRIFALRGNSTPACFRKDPVVLIGEAIKELEAPLTDLARYAMFADDVGASLSAADSAHAAARTALLAHETHTVWQTMNSTDPRDPLPPPLPYKGMDWDVLARMTLDYAWERASTLEWLLDSVAVHSGKLELVDGMETLPAALQESILSHGARIRYNARAVRVAVGNRRDRRKVEVVRDDAAAGVVSEDYDFVVCAVPARAAARIDFPDLTREQRWALLNTSYMPAAKALISSPERYWELDPDLIAGGSSVSDLPIQQSWYPSDNAVPETDRVGFAPPDEIYHDDNADDPYSPGSHLPDEAFHLQFWRPDQSADGLAKSHSPGCFIGAYMWGEAAREFGSMNRDERREFVLSNVENYHPWVQDHRDQLAVEGFSWDDESSPGGGAFACFAPGEHARYQAVLTEPVPKDGPRIFFAGEHLAVLHGWMQGALQSGRSATRCLVHAIARS